jgi:hypothetical protein
MKNHLPCYAIPEIVNIGLHAFPILPVSGKIDRQKLLQMYADQKSRSRSSMNSKDSWIEKAAASELNVDALNKLKILIDTMEEAADVIYNPSSIGDLHSDNFFTIGGSSLNAVTVILALDQKGYHISVEEFLSAHSFIDLMDQVNARTNDELNGGRKELLSEYEFLPITMTDSQEVSQFASTYMNSDQIGLLIHQGDKAIEKQLYDHYYPVVLDWMPEAIKSGASFLVKKNNLLVGVYINFDGTNMNHKDVNYTCKEDLTHGGIIDRFLDYMEEPVSHTLSKRYRKILKSVVAYIDLNKIRSPETRVALMYEMEERVIALAEELNFDVIVSTNVSPLTQDAAEVLGYEAVNVCYLKSYQDRVTGFFPFHAANERDCVKVQVREIK